MSEIYIHAQTIDIETHNQLEPVRGVFLSTPTSLSISTQNVRHIAYKNEGYKASVLYAQSL